ncbi:MAG: TolC family protein [Vicinamibacterales bacterium]
MKFLNGWHTRGLLIFCGLTAAAMTATVSAQGPSRLTLAQAVQDALVQNDRMIAQNDTAEQANLSVRLARNTFSPKVVPNVLGSFGQSDVSNQTYRLDLTQKLTTGTELKAGVGTTSAQIPGASGIPGQGDIRFYNTDTTFAVSQPLLRGFGPTVARRSLTSAEQREIDARRQRTLAEQQVTVEVASSYYHLVAQQTLVEVARKSLDRSRSLRDASEAKLDAGLVSQLDVFRAQQLVAQAESQLFDAESAVEDARDQLAFLLGRESGTGLDVATEIPKDVDPIAADAAVATALDKRLDLQSAVAAAAEADRATAYSRNQLLPQVDVNLAMTRRQTADGFANSFGLDNFKAVTFLSISMPVDRTPGNIEYQNTLIDRDRRRREIETLQRRIRDDVRRAVRQRDRVLRNLAAAETSVEIGQKEVEVAQFRYERGLSNNLDVVTAEASLLAAESRRISALADAATSRIGMRAVLGLLDPRTDIIEPASTSAAK